MMSLTLTAPASTGPRFPVDTLDAVTWIDDVAITGFTVPEAIGSSAPLNYTASSLPAGVSMSSARLVSGTPTATGTGTATITVTDDDNDTDTLTFDWTVADDSMPSFDSATIPDQVWVTGEEITPFTAPLATSGNGDLNYGVNNLPPGVIMLDTRRFQGLPTGAGSGTATLAAIDANGDIATLTFNWTVTAQLSFGSASIAAQTWTAGQAITAVAVPAASGGTGTLRYEAEGLPSGISLTTARQISGRPLTNGSGTAKVKAIDANGNTATLMFQWTVADPNSPSTGTVLSASANPSTRSDYTISGNYTGTRDYLTWELHESDTRGNDRVYPVSPSTFTQNIVGRTNGTYTYRLEGCYLERHPMYTEAVELCGSVGDSLTVTVNGPAPDSVATQLGYTLQARSGRIGTNGPRALFIDRTSSATGGGVFQDVILKQVGSGFELVAPDSEPTVTPSGWPVATGVELVLDDINLDGFVDILVRDLSDAISGAQDQIVYAPGHKGGAVGTIRAVDDSLTQFLSEVASWTENPMFFDDRTSSYQEPIVRFQETCYPDEDSQYCSYLPIVIGYVTVTIYTNASSEARKFANLFPVLNGSINLDIDLGSVQATSLSKLFRNVLGTEILNRQLERTCTGSFAYDSDTSLPCDSPTRIGRILLGLLDWIIPPAHSQDITFVQLPAEWPGLVKYGTVNGQDVHTEGQWGTLATIESVKELGTRWNARFPNGPLVQVGDISLERGGPMPGHGRGHQIGKNVDIRPMRRDGANEGVRYDHPDYDRARTQELIDEILKDPNVRRIFFNDDDITGPDHIMASDPDGVHDDHIHVEFTR